MLNQATFCMSDQSQMPINHRLSLFADWYFVFLFMLCHKSGRFFYLNCLYFVMSDFIKKTTVLSFLLFQTLLITIAKSSLNPLHLRWRTHLIKIIPLVLFLYKKKYISMADKSSNLQYLFTLHQLTLCYNGQQNSCVY